MSASIDRRKPAGYDCTVAATTTSREGAAGSRELRGGDRIGELHAAAIVAATEFLARRG